MSHRLPRVSRLGLGQALLLGAALVLGCVDLRVAGPREVLEVRLTPDTVALRVGDSSAVQAAPLDASAAWIVQRRITWMSSAPGVASVDTAGLVRGVASGVATLTATVGGVEGTAVVLVSGAPTTIALFAGDAQTAAVNVAVPIAPAVRVLDATSNPVSGVDVTFAIAGGGGSVTSAVVSTGFDGVATVGSWTLGPAAGANSLTATVAEAGVAGNPVTFTATGTVGPPDAAQSSITASPAAIAPSSGLSFSTVTVTVRDAAGSTVMGASVVLSATGTGNVITQPTATTNAAGQVTGALSSTDAGIKMVSAVVNGTTSITQTASVDVTAAAAAGLVVSTQPAGAVSNAVFVTQPVVEIRDAFGNRVLSSSDPVTVSLVSGDGTLVSAGGSFTVSAVNGRATFSGLSIRGTSLVRDTLGTGPQVLQFSTPGFTAVRADTVQVGVSYAYNVVDVFTRNSCLACHGFTVANMVNQPAVQVPCAPGIRVVPADTANSVLYDKIRRATPACGTVMPTSGLMSAIQIRIVRDWILQGAKNN